MSDKSYQIDVSWNGDILLIVLSGQATELNADEITLEVVKIATENSPSKLFIDARYIKGRMGISHTFYQVRKYKYIATKIAVVDLPENEEHFSFLEVAARNTGLAFRCFADPEEAMAWLQSLGDS